jgi:hypothetical protein
MQLAIKEDYIHYLWKSKLLLIYPLQIKNGGPISIINPGIHNESNSGPDFLMASIKINQLVWFGNIEIHVNSSDWYNHQHHKDSNYNNVILHIVYNDNKPVIQNGHLIPTIEISPYVNNDHYNRYINFFKFKTPIVCSQKLYPQYQIEYINQQKKSFEHRMNRKLMRYSEAHPEEIFNRLAARIFGGITNGDYFESIEEKITIQNSEIDSKNGTIYPSVKNNFSESSFDIQQTISKGHWPQGNPKKRFSEWMLFKQKFQIIEEIQIWKNDINIENSILRFRNRLKDNHSSFMINNLILNALLPFLYQYSRLNHRIIKKSELITAYKNLPPEENKITRKWNKIGIKIKNAYESQASLEIYKQFCLNKQCANCEVGQKIIGK